MARAKIGGDQILINKRKLAAQTATPFGGGAATTTSGPQPAKGVAAPPVTQRIVISQLTIQNNSDVSMNIVLGGLGRTIVAPVNGSGIDWSDEKRLPPGTGFIPDVSVAENCHIAGHFYLEDVETGEPIQ